MEEDERRRDRCVRRGLFGPMKLGTNPLLFPVFTSATSAPVWLRALVLLT